MHTPPAVPVASVATYHSVDGHGSGYFRQPQSSDHGHTRQMSFDGIARTSTPESPSGRTVSAAVFKSRSPTLPATAPIINVVRPFPPLPPSNHPKTPNASL
ncbi:hypothetical protein EXIGLDRAFT_719517, partial [Exidia glandulosa HHB12029]